MTRREGALITDTVGGHGRAAAQLFAREVIRAVRCDIEDNRATHHSIGSVSRSMLARQPGDRGGKAEVVELLARTAGERGGLHDSASSLRIRSYVDVSDEDSAHTPRSNLELGYRIVQPVWCHLVEDDARSAINELSAESIYGYTVAHATIKDEMFGNARIIKAGHPTTSESRVCAPGLIETPASTAITTAERGHVIAGNIPHRRVGVPGDIPHYSPHLTSDESSRVTGINFVIDDGQTSHQPVMPA